MNNLAYLQKIAETYKLTKDNPIMLFTENGNVSIQFNATRYSGLTFDQCISDIKQSMAIMFLEQIEMQK